jgi:hypothetical protein
MFYALAEKTCRVAQFSELHFSKLDYHYDFQHPLYLTGNDFTFRQGYFLHFQKACIVAQIASCVFIRFVN